jgi:SAM-dependent methyltransferase
MGCVDAWDARGYDRNHSYVTRYGGDVVGLLAARPGERILDLGCGTGHLTAKIAEAGAGVVGLDRSPEMVAEARRNYPGLAFVEADGTDFRFDAPFDAVFSNAAIHWMHPPEGVAACVSRALKPGGRFVAEMGGKGNVRTVRDGFFRVLEAVGGSPGSVPNPWYYPSIAEYGTLLERFGLSLASAALFPRPTVVEGGTLRGWMEMFGAALLSGVPEADRDALLDAMEEVLRPLMFRDGDWYVDYVRLRFVAVKEGESGGGRAGV